MRYGSIYVWVYIISIITDLHIYSPTGQACLSGSVYISINRSILYTEMFTLHSQVVVVTIPIEQILKYGGKPLYCLFGTQAKLLAAASGHA